MSADIWFSIRRARREPSFRIFCFPHVGAGASVFNEWQPAWIPEDVELWAVKLPGRERRLREKPFRRLPPLVDAVYEAMAPYLDEPYALCGHSLGALIGFELARKIRRNGKPAAARLFVSAHAAPQLGVKPPILHMLPDKDFAAELRRFGGTSEEIFANQDLLDIMLPVLRADFEVNETYVYEDDLALDCPISAFGGINDHELRPDEVEAWKILTSDQFSFRMMAGNHFFIFRSPDFLACVARDLGVFRNSK
jgi:medium-chain acyl-[acyl-carrier-protein] hydrolase